MMGVALTTSKTRRHTETRCKISPTRHDGDFERVRARGIEDAV